MKSDEQTQGIDTEEAFSDPVLLEEILASESENENTQSGMVVREITATVPGTEEPKKEKYTLKQFMLDCGVSILSVVLVLVLSRTVFMSAFVPSSSMYPAVHNPCVVYANRLAYKHADPQRGDIVFFKRANPKVNIHLCKRVIGLPNETVEIRDGIVYIDGEKYDEDYIVEKPAEENFVFHVPDGCYFLMGDNRNDSEDARYWDEHFVPAQNIKAKAVFSLYFFGISIYNNN